MTGTMKDTWGQWTPRVEKQWNLLTEKEIASVEGDKRLLAALIERRYGYSELRAAREVSAFFAL